MVYFVYWGIRKLSFYVSNLHEGGRLNKPRLFFLRLSAARLDLGHVLLSSLGGAIAGRMLRGCEDFNVERRDVPICCKFLSSPQPVFHAKLGLAGVRSILH